MGAMSYLNQSEIAANGPMLERVSQCATQQNVPDAATWATMHRREWAAAPGWDAAWASAQASHPPTPPDPDNPTTTPAYDPGTDEAVITDQMILSQVQAMNPPA